MKLYTFDVAPNARRLQLFLDCKGIELDTQQVDLLSGEQLQEPFASINPLRTIPALQLDDGTVLTEVVAQVHYLESLYPDRPLMGTTDLEKAQVLQWDHIVMLHGLASLRDMYRNYSERFKGRGMTGASEVAQIPELVERGKLLLGDFWGVLESRLQDTPWLAGDNFTFADITLVCMIEFAGWVKESVPEGCATVKGWQERAAAAMS